MTRQLSAVDDSVRLDHRQMTAPIEGDQTRSAVMAIVDNLAIELGDEIKGLHDRVERLHELVIQSSARSKNALNEHITTCRQVRAEITNLSSVVAALEKAHADN